MKRFKLGGATKASDQVHLDKAEMFLKYQKFK